MEEPERRPYVALAVMSGLAAYGVRILIDWWSISAFRELRSHSLHVSFAHELLVSVVPGIFGFAAVSLMAVALLAAGWRRMFALPAGLIAFHSILSLAVLIRGEGTGVWRMIVRDVALPALSLVPAMAVRRRLPARERGRVGTDQMVAITICAVLALGGGALLSAMMQGFFYYSPREAFFGALTVAPFFVFGASLTMRTPAGY